MERGRERSVRKEEEMGVRGGVCVCGGEQERRVGGGGEEEEKEEEEEEKAHRYIDTIMCTRHLCTP